MLISVRISSELMQESHYHRLIRAEVIALVMRTNSDAEAAALRGGTVEDLRAAMCAAREQLIADMTCYFWQQVAAFPYVVTPALRSALGEELRRYRRYKSLRSEAL